MVGQETDSLEKRVGKMQYQVAIPQKALVQYQLSRTAFNISKRALQHRILLIAFVAEHSIRVRL